MIDYLENVHYFDLKSSFSIGLVSSTHHPGIGRGLVVHGQGPAAPVGDDDVVVSLTEEALAHALGRGKVGRYMGTRFRLLQT